MPIPQWFEKDYKQPHSIELNKNANGSRSWSIKLYFANGEAQLALREIAAIDDELTGGYMPVPKELEKQLEKSVEMKGRGQ